MAKPYLTQPAGRSPKAPPRLWFHELTYQAESWDRARRVVLVVRERPGELYPDHFWLLTSLSRKRYEAEALLAQYRKRGKSGRPHGGVDGRARSGLVLREPAQDALSGQTAEAGSEAGSDDGGRSSTPQRSLVPAESAGVRDPAPGSGADGAGDASGLESASFSRAGVASGESGASQGRRLIFVISQGGDGLESGCGRDWRGCPGRRDSGRRRHRARGRDRNGGDFSPEKSTCRRVTAPLAVKRFMTGSIVCFRADSVESTEFKRNRAPTARKRRVEALINMFHE